MTYLILAMALAGGTLSGCTTSKTALEQRRAEASWNAFCDARGYDRDDNTYANVNEYLDTWRGSVEEEAALDKAGI